MKEGCRHLLVPVVFAVWQNYTEGFVSPWYFCLYNESSKGIINNKENIGDSVHAQV